MGEKLNWAVIDNFDLCRAGGFSGRRPQIDEAGVKNMNSRVRNTVITGPRNFTLELRF